jgi:RNA polymerase sigma-70 factor (ECF subfamily)
MMHDGWRDAQDDSELAEVRAARTGDVDAFERLYRRHHARIDRTARWLLASPDVADAVQEIFVRAWRKLATFDARASFGTWLHRLAVNVLLRARAERGRWRERHDVLTGAEPIPGSSTPAEVRLDLDAAIASLPDGAREVFVLVEVDGYSHAEVGALLDVSPHTSRSQLHRARTLLRSRLQGSSS